MIKRIKKFIRGGDAATVDRAIEHVEAGECSCRAISYASGADRFVWLYRMHSLARTHYTGFRDISTCAWFDMDATERRRIRIDRLTAFKESLK